MIINGTGKPRISAFNANYRPAWISYDFPYCNINGISDETTKESNVVELESGKLIETFFGYRTQFTLDFNDQLDGQYCLYLSDLLLKSGQGWDIFLTPHIDAAQRQIKVLFTNKPILLKLLAGASGFKAMKEIQIEMISVELSAGVNWFNSDNLSYGLLDGWT